MTSTETTQQTEPKQEIRRAAQTAFDQSPDWVAYYREILGLQGIVRQKYPTLDSLAEFEKSGVFEEIQRNLRKLRERRPVPTDPDEPTRVITVRLPKSMHEALRVEAHEHHTSMNKLCISKLLQFIDNALIPKEP